MNAEQKIGLLSEALSRHVRNLRLTGGLSSLSAIEEQHGDQYRCEIAFSGLHQEAVTVTKKNKDEAGDDIAKCLAVILKEESVELKKLIAKKQADVDIIDAAVAKSEAPETPLVTIK